MSILSKQLSRLRNLSYVLDEGITLSDGSVMTAHKCVIERESINDYVMLFDFTGELFYQEKFTPLLQSTIIELCGAVGVNVTSMDLTK